MKPPIIVNESTRIDQSGDVFLCESAAYVEDYLEVIDVENGEFFAFDSEGRLLKLETKDGRVCISDAEDEPNHRETLRCLLVDFFSRAGYPESQYQDAPLEDLVAIGSEKFGTSAAQDHASIRRLRNGFLIIVALISIGGIVVWILLS